MGNLYGDHYIMHINGISQGLGNCEQQFYLWFSLTLKIAYVLYALGARLELLIFDCAQ